MKNYKLFILSGVGLILLGIAVSFGWNLDVLNNPTFATFDIFLGAFGTAFFLMPMILFLYKWVIED